MKSENNRRNAFAYNALRGQQPQTFLDVGCGNGHTIAYFMDKWDCEFYGVDLSPVACKIARRTNATIVNTFIENYTPDIKFDVITCMGVAEHFLDIVVGLRAIQNILSGVLYLEVPDCLSYSEGGPGYRGKWYLSREAWDDKIEGAGFNVVESIKGEMPFWEFVYVLA